MKSGCWTIMWNGRDCGASEMNYHHPQKRPVFIQRWCCVCGGTGRESSIMSSLLLLFSCQVMSDFCDPMDCSMPSFPVPHHLLEFAQVHVHCISDAIQPSHPLSPPSPSVSIFHSNQVFSNESTVLIRWPKYWSSSSSPSNEYSGLISFKIDWFDLIAVQGTHKSLLQHHSLKASMFWHSALFTVQLFQPYMTTGKTIVLLYGPSGKPKD